MHQTEYRDGRVVRQFVQEETEGALVHKLKSLHEQSITDPEVVRVTQQKILGRNDLCPCGSGKKFKRCCIYQIHS